jgi:O-acetyl-ADP-ribose deacetylase (regulator of RNase III)
VFKAVKKKFSGQKIAYPKIGSGLARGNWKKIASIIDSQLAGEDHTLVEYHRH